MTDVYVSCARDDADRLKPVVQALRDEGWSLWFEPDATPGRREQAIDAELGAAGAVIVLWSASSRGSEFVRTEAATGLYRNKLIQIRMDGESAPRPFDQLELIDLSGWDGSTSNAVWQRIVGCVRLFAGAPGADRPQVVRNSAAGFASAAAVRKPMRPLPLAPQPTQHDPLPDVSAMSSRGAPEPRPRFVALPDEPEAVVAEPAAPEPAKPVFDAPVDDVESAPHATQHTLSEANAPAATVTPAAGSASPISEAISAMERTLSGVARQSARTAAEDNADVFDDDVDDRRLNESAGNNSGRERQSDSLFSGEQEHWSHRTPVVDDRHYDRSADADTGRSGKIAVEDMIRPDTIPSDTFTRSGRAAGRRMGYEERRSNGAAPVAIVGLLAVLGGGAWFVDPMGWRDGGDKAAFAASPGVIADSATTGGDALVELAATGPLQDDPAADAAWTAVDRSDASALRTFIGEYNNSTASQTARALLKVLDAQAWADSVTADTEESYSSYLAAFPAPGGEMSGAASNRLESLLVERRAAITTIQTELNQLGLYNGVNTGSADHLIQQAANRFAARFGGAAPELGEAAPRDLRAFGDRILAEVQKQTDPTTEAALVAAAEVAQPAAPAPASVTPAASETTAGQSQAEIAAAAAAQAAQAEEAMASRADAEAWLQAVQVGTVASYQSYLAAFPAGTETFAANAAIDQLTRPAAFSLDWLGGETRSAVEAARADQRNATVRAGAARSTAARADEIATSARSGIGEARTITAPDGDIYETQVSGSQPNGLGVRTAGDAVSRGDRYRGELRNGLGQGLGVFEYGDNPNNASAQVQRYEGEHANDVASGFGVIYWKNGNRFEGRDGGATEHGVLTFANGQRYEGEMRNGNRHGYGVFWSASGEVMMAGRWEDGDLVQPMAAPRRGTVVTAGREVVDAGASGPKSETEADADIAPSPSSMRVQPSRTAPPTQQGGLPIAADEADEKVKWLKSGPGGGRRPDRF